MGPLLRRAQPDLVVICLASFVPLALRFSVRELDSDTWLAHDDAPLAVKVTPTLYFYFARIRPERKLRTGVTLAYGIGVKAGDAVGDAVDYAPFEAIVKSDELAYAPATLPTFVLQTPRSQLNALYGSCRKIHDTDGGQRDALADGDLQVARTFKTPDKRPAILCLGGDQIYADDVHELVSDEIAILAKKLEGQARESLPDAASMGARGREPFIKKKAKFTSDDTDRHVASLCEYLALYGLMWNGRNWSQAHKPLAHFTKTLPQVRRLLANIPSYMIFDDHDVTDDWNLDMNWRDAVELAPLGRRIVANALMAFWLCQGLGNDPDGWGEQRTPKLVELIEQRQRRYKEVDTTFWKLDGWEFSTPTTPLVYFLDTRTQRGTQDDRDTGVRKAPAFLKTRKSWATTVARLNKLLQQQGPELPLVLVSAAPVFGFDWIEALQRFTTVLFGVYKYDFENWAANETHFNHFLELMAGRNVVVLSGDVHYGYSSTVRHVQFDSRTSRGQGPRSSATGVLPAIPGAVFPSYRPRSTAQYIQLCSSAMNNSVGSGIKQTVMSIPAALSGSGFGQILDDDGQVQTGLYVNGVFVMVELDADGHIRQVIRQPADVKPVTLFRQRINDPCNSRYLPDHNLGLLAIRDKSVEHCYLMDKGRQSERRWDFSNGRYWE
jgi:hypothetical protein